MITIISVLPELPDHWCLNHARTLLTDISRPGISTWTSLNFICPNGTNQPFPRSLIHSSPECPIFIIGTILHPCAHVSNLAPLPYVQLVSCQSHALTLSGTCFFSTLTAWTIPRASKVFHSSAFIPANSCCRSKFHRHHQCYVTLNMEDKDHAS